MKFNCSEISINDEELGCQITFFEDEELVSSTERLSVDELSDSIGKYLLIQRSFSENEADDGGYYYETQDDNISGDLKDFEIVLSRQCFELKLPVESIEIIMNPSEEDFAELKRVVSVLTSEHGKLTVRE